MNGVTSASATSSTAHARGPVAARAAPPGSLPPPPAPDFAGVGSLQDALLTAYADRVAQGLNNARTVQAGVVNHRKDSAIQQKKMEEARSAQRAAERESRGFWSKLKKVASTVAKIAAVVAGAAACVASAGTGAPFVIAVAAMALSTGGTAVRELKLLGKDSDKIGAGMELTGAALSVGSAGASALSTSATAASASSNAVTATRVSSAATAVSATATVTSAGAGIGVAYHEREARMSEADFAKAQAAMDQHRVETRMLIAAYEAAEEAERDALAGTIKAIEATNQAATVAINGVRG